MANPRRKCPRILDIRLSLAVFLLNTVQRLDHRELVQVQQNNGAIFLRLPKNWNHCP